MTVTARRTIVPRGAFALGQSIDFGFGQREAGPDDGVLRMAFVADGYREPAGVTVTQRDDGELDVEITGPADPDVVVTQTARVLSLDIDATGWDELCAREELLGRLCAARPGLRPPLFHSAYEAAAWSVLSARRPRRQMTALRDRFAAAYGTTFSLAGVQLSAFPTPEQLLAVDAFPGLPEVKLRRLHGVARLAASGGLDTAALRATDPAEASTQVMALEGIGPMYASLIVLRALGHQDLVPVDEPIILGVLGELLGRDAPVTQAEFEAIAAPWTPWRLWGSVFVRAAGPRLLPADSVVGRKSVSR